MKNAVALQRVVWMLVSTLVLFAAAALVIAPRGQGTIPGAGYFNCGMKNQIAGSSWAVRTVDFKCKTGLRVVAKVATLTLPAAVGREKLVHVPGKPILGIMRCLAGPPRSTATSMTCAEVDGDGVLLAARMK